MFAGTREENKPNGAGVIPPMSASDQRIEYRPFASAMKVMLDGEEFTIRPPSFHVSNIIKQFKLDYARKMSKQRDIAVEIGKRLDDQLNKLRENAVQGEQAEPGVADENNESEMQNVEAMVNVYEEIQGELFKIQSVSDREMMRLVQLIILDGNARHKKWRDDYDEFPPDDFLEKNSITYDRLYRHVDVVEMQVLLDVYNQMNRPEYARKNFQALSPLM